MGKKEHIEPNFFGGFTHYDEKGHKTGTSEPNLFGGYTHYDEKGHKTGTSEPDLFGGFTDYDANGKKTGRTEEGLFGELIHYDEKGHKTATNGPWLLDTREPLRGMISPFTQSPENTSKKDRAIHEPPKDSRTTHEPLKEVRAVPEPPEEAPTMQQPSGSGQKIEKICSIIAIILTIALLLGILIGLPLSNAKKTKTLYAEMERLVEKEDYFGAEARFEEMPNKNYEDARDLYQLCIAHIAYYAGEYERAYYSLIGAQFEHCSAGQRSEINAFKKQVDEAYFEALAQEQREKEEAATLKSEPYVGMYVTDAQIAAWSWMGEDYRTCVVKTTKYNYETADRGYTLWVDENNKIQKVSYVERGTKNKPSGGSHSLTPSRPDADGYTDPDDFYYDHPDDFWDYEDAEDYFYEHEGD